MTMTWKRAKLSVTAVALKIFQALEATAAGEVALDVEMFTFVFQQVCCSFIICMSTVSKNPFISFHLQWSDADCRPPADVIDGRAVGSFVNIEGKWVLCLLVLFHIPLDGMWKEWCEKWRERKVWICPGAFCLFVCLFTHHVRGWELLFSFSWNLG